MNDTIFFNAFTDEETQELAFCNVKPFPATTLAGAHKIFGHYAPLGEDKKRPIVWNVIKKDAKGALLVSYKGLEKMPYSSKNCRWEDSDIKKFLNTTFFDAAFSDEEKQHIQNRDDATGRVFLLAENEVSVLQKARHNTWCHPANQQAGLEYQIGDGTWYLRYGKETDGHAALLVPSDTKVREEKASEAHLIRPAIWIDCEPKTLRFGKYHYEEDGKEKKLEWFILDFNEDTALLMSKYAVDAQPFNPAGGSTWDTSYIRYWLNHDFLNAAFTDAEQAQIVPMTIHTENNKTYDTPGGADTTDFAHLLSNTEYMQYMNRNNWDKTHLYYGSYYMDAGRPVCEPTPYVAQKISSLTTPDRWWLRVPGQTLNLASYVKKDGKAGDAGASQKTAYMVRPVILVKRDKLF